MKEKVLNESVFPEPKATTPTFVVRSADKQSAAQTDKVIEEMARRANAQIS